MENLKKLLRRFSFFILFLIFETVALVLVFTGKNYQRVSFLNSTNGVVGRIYDSYADFRSYFYLKGENELLAQENARLRAQVEVSYKKYYRYTGMGGDTLMKPAFKYIPAKVINNSVDEASNFFTIDAGAYHGIRPDMGVISPNGIAGVVKGVSENFAVCISVLNVKNKISVQHKKSKEYGALEWDGKSTLFAPLKEISTHIQLVKGDTVETTGFSSIFPEGIMVGTVEDFTVNPDDGYYEIRVKLSTNFHALRNVYCVDYLFRYEQDALEDSLKQP